MNRIQTNQKAMRRTTDRNDGPRRSVVVRQKWNVQHLLERAENHHEVLAEAIRGSGVKVEVHVLPSGLQEATFGTFMNKNGEVRAHVARFIEDATQQ